MITTAAVAPLLSHKSLLSHAYPARRVRRPKDILLSKYRVATRIWS